MSEPFDDDFVEKFLAMEESDDDGWEEGEPCPECGAFVGLDEIACTACGMVFRDDDGWLN